MAHASRTTLAGFWQKEDSVESTAGDPVSPMCLICSITESTLLDGVDMSLEMRFVSKRGRLVLGISSPPCTNFRNATSRASVSRTIDLSLASFASRTFSASAFSSSVGSSGTAAIAAEADSREVVLFVTGACTELPVVAMTDDSDCCVPGDCWRKC